jgi:hypothetical protein
MKGDCARDELLDLFARAADDADTRKVGAIGAPGFPLLLDDYEIRAHLLFGLRNPACRRIFIAVPTGTSAPDRPATVTFPGFNGCAY